MSDAMQSHLERFPEGAIEVAQGRILDFNRAAQAQFPELAVGMEAPAFLSPTLSDPEAAKKLLSTPQAQKLLQLLGNQGKPNP